MIHDIVRRRNAGRHLFVIAILVLAVYVIVPQLGSFSSSWELLRQPDPAWLLLAVSFTALTYFAAAATYCLLAFRPLVYSQTILIQLAAMFVNRLLPAGIGALGINYAYLSRKGHSSLQAGSLVAVNNLLGWLGHSLILAIACLLYPGQILSALNHNQFSTGTITFVFIALIIILGLGVILVKRRLYRAIAKLRETLVHYRRQLSRLWAALLSSTILTLSNILALSAVAMALDVHLPLVVILVVFTFGVAAGTATPTPGGIGGYETALAAALIIYGVDNSAALAVALLYRLISYWLPLAAGAVAFIVCQRRQLIYAN